MDIFEVVVTEKEAAVIEFVYLLSSKNLGKRTLSLEEIMRILDYRVQKRDNMKIYELLKEEGRDYIEELVRHLERL